MKLTGESLIAARRTAVWAALSDPQVRARCAGAAAVPPPAGGGDAGARFAAGRPAFTGGVALTETDAPRRCVLVSHDGHSSADITLGDAAGDGTRLTYVVTAATGDDAQATTKAFFARLKAEAERDPDPAPSGTATRAAVHHEATDATGLHGNRTASGLTPLVWGGILILAVLAVLVWQLSA